MTATNIRKLISVIAVLCVLVTALPVGAAQPLPDATPRFSDVPADHLFTDDVDWLAAEGIARGCNPPANDRFYPDAEVSRAQLAAFLHRAWAAWGGSVSGEAPSSGFADVASGSVFSADIDWLAAEGITRGCNPPAKDRFCPDAPVTRGQAAAMIVRALGIPTPSSSIRFADVPQDHLFADAISAIAANGVTRGCGFADGAGPVFCPDDPLTRAEMAAFLHRVDSIASDFIGDGTQTGGDTGSDDDPTDTDTGDSDTGEEVPELLAIPNLHFNATDTELVEFRFAGLVLGGVTPYTFTSDDLTRLTTRP